MRDWYSKYHHIQIRDIYMIFHHVFITAVVIFWVSLCYAKYISIYLSILQAKIQELTPICIPSSKYVWLFIIVCVHISNQFEYLYRYPELFYSILDVCLHPYYSTTNTNFTNIVKVQSFSVMINNSMHLCLIIPASYMTTDSITICRIGGTIIVKNISSCRPAAVSY